MAALALMGNLSLTLLSLGLLVLTLILLLQVMAALIPGRIPLPVPRVGGAALTPLGWEQLRVAVLVPAHNEALLIQDTLAAIAPQLKAQDTLLVVADNCDDATAALGREAGSTVLERWDPDRRGKGYALDYGLQWLQAQPPDVLVVVDADCHCHPGSLAAIALAAHTCNRPIQALYRLETPPNPSLKDLISAFAMTVKNAVRMRGMARLGLPCPLGGTGMAFPWSALGRVSLASGHIVEDMKLGIDLAIAGYPPLFYGSAQVSGSFPQEAAASTSQRTRWEHGHLQLLRDYTPLLVRAALQQKRLDLGMMALDLAIPPLSLLVLLWGGLVALAAVSWAVGGSLWPLVLGAIAGLTLLGAIAAAWVGFARRELPLHKLLAIPLYILWKIPLYFKFLIKPQSQWVRTQRDAPDDSKGS
ncbi:glycosyltransferase family 2 protein [Prochlorothrix hollandica]|uniref:Glycosyl transferase n=1 Tax=Prochlorothrix hollandica PCC 9006 = CALU 1027 TaxID=317619 RepID=A0A0M2PX19_PROHO|nr:glycosyltransferase family 2 protein [Prochlorothrix hollandica]KKI98906.1 glycosyl transferase [Prochlorothrix hollandica PCC 9006 = CALU 1027]